MRKRKDRPEAVNEACGLEAIAWGLRDAGVRLVTGYPGFHAHELIDRCDGVLSVNERTAYAIAWGTSAAGIRAAVAFKNVGLNDAADPFLNSMRLRVGAGLVVVVLDDVEVEGSQCRQDSRAYFDLCPGLWLEPVSARHAHWCAREAPALSERFGVPVVLRLTNALLRSRGPVRCGPAAAPARPLPRDPALQVAHPVNVRLQACTATARQEAITAFVDRLYDWPPPRPGAPVVVQVGASGDPASRPAFPRPRTVWTYPLPDNALRRLMAGAAAVETREQGGPFVCGKLRALTAGLEVRPADLSARADHSLGYRVSSTFEPLYEALRSFPGRIVCGDLGSFTMDPARTVELCLCYGASVAVAIGCSLARPGSPTFCVTGDAAFLHSGQACLEEGALRGADVVVILLDNGGAASTGGQQVPASLRLPPGLPVLTMDHSRADADAYRRALGRLLDLRGMCVLHVAC